MSSIAGPNQTSTHFNKPSYVGRLLSLHRKIKTVTQTILRKSKHQIKFFFNF